MAPLGSYPQVHMLPLVRVSAESLGTGKKGLLGAPETWDTVKQPTGAGSLLCMSWHSPLLPAHSCQQGGPWPPVWELQVRWTGGSGQYVAVNVHYAG